MSRWSSIFKSSLIKYKTGTQEDFYLTQDFVLHLQLHLNINLYKVYHGLAYTKQQYRFDSTSKLILL